MTIGIYYITNVVNGKYYIGSSLHIERRFKEHLNGLNKNKHHNRSLQFEWNSFGQSSFVFSIVDKLSSANAATVFSLEQFYLDAVKDWASVYNISRDTTNWVLGIKYKDSNYYSWNKEKKVFVVAYRVNGIQLKFGYFEDEEDAKCKVDYLKSLTKLQLIEYHKNIDPCKLTRKNNNNLVIMGEARRRSFKGYSFDKKRNVWRVRFPVTGKTANFGSFKFEKDAQKKVEEIISNGRCN